MPKRTRKNKDQPPPPPEAAAAASLPEDLLVEVLARVPYRSLCRFKSVSKPWLALCSDPGLRKRSPQALSGFFCYARDHWNRDLRFLNISGKGRPLVDPGLPFLRAVWDGGVKAVDCCGGLLLCRCWKVPSISAYGAVGVDYVVCNPATEEWTVVPPTDELHQKNVVRLGFDPLVPSRFAVFVLVRHYGITGVEIFSSETGAWTSKDSEWGDRITVDDHNSSVSVFFDGALHLTTHDSSVITVDTEGDTWRKIRMPLGVADTSDYGFIAHSQGRLYAMHMDYSDGNCDLSVWVLEDYDSGQWTLKHTAHMSEIIRHDQVCTFVAVDPECKLIYFQTNGLYEKLVAYDMEKRRYRVIFSFERKFNLPCEPYIPSYMELL